MFKAFGSRFKGSFKGILGLCSDYLYSIRVANIKLNIFKELCRVLVFKVYRISS
jgi:hypothetical protein